MCRQSPEGVFDLLQALKDGHPFGARTNLCNGLRTPKHEFAENG